MSNEFLWVEKYRPQQIADCILSDELKQTFEKIVASGDLPHMLFSGTAGTGKTTVAKALCNQLNLDWIIINGSEDGNIDTLRGKIKQFASTVSLQGGVKVVILDEADYLNAQSTQPALRGFIEEFSSNCRFILTCNFKNRIIEPLHSRCGVYEFNTSKKNTAVLMQQMFDRACMILDSEGVEYDKKDLLPIISKFGPDWRRCLNELQRRSVLGFDVSSTADMGGSIEDLIKTLKDKNFKEMRKWVVNNIDTDASAIFRGLYDNANNSIEPQSVPQLILILADYQYKHAFVADHELNVVACLTEVMANVKFS